MRSYGNCPGISKPFFYTKQNFEVCLSGLENRRLFYDEHYKIFQLLPQNKQKHRHSPLSMNLTSNKATGTFEKATLFLVQVLTL